MSRARPPQRGACRGTGARADAGGDRRRGRHPAGNQHPGCACSPHRRLRSPRRAVARLDGCRAARGAARHRLTALLSVVGIIGGQSPPPAMPRSTLRAASPSRRCLRGCSENRVRNFGVSPAMEAGSDPDFPAAGGSARPRSVAVDRRALRHGDADPRTARRSADGDPRLGCTRRSVLLVLALAAPIAGFTLHFEYSAAAALVHVAAAALLLVSTAHVLGRAA